jgi:hypothetical protein
MCTGGSAPGAPVTYAGVNPGIVDPLLGGKLRVGRSPQLRRRDVGVAESNGWGGGAQRTADTP